MANKRFGLTGKVAAMTISPLIVLSFVMSVFIGYSGYRNVCDEVSDEMSGICVSVFEMLEHNRRYVTEKYDFFDDNPDLFDGITESTGIYITIFEGDERKITTVTNAVGERAVGTKAASEVVDTVIGKNEEFFSDNVDVNGTPFFGYYMPLTDSGGAVTGMVFAGKSRESVMVNLFNPVAGSLVLSWATALAAGLLSVLVSRGMVNSLLSAANFLKMISQGDTDCVADSRFVDRRDEIGDMGRSAVRLQQALKNLISNDPLTGLYNRRACGIKMKDMRIKAETENAPFVAAIGDIDFFKQLNDNYGHACGDKVLKDIAGILSDGVRDVGFVSRWGGEEFLLVFGVPYNEAAAAVRRIMDNIHNYRCRYEGMEISVTMTFGISDYCGGTVDALVKTADDKLYYGKNHGRDRVVEYIPQEIEEQSIKQAQ